ncbi:DUF4388 domain-containing protein [Deinococcus psychrotolerans]|uniref:DUF4388 domain-containing protein n=1 Tax=Deinococcus psychrotolerans TaxID=2489213 RepID=A0A3G8YQ51_9DEIO|nr:DUF4388 domain-containing protein [Deinococcus psychrotolerans]AZI43316.1 DUF4388 domain-containing protein [Deinococcus psychrotolerans]
MLQGRDFISPQLSVGGPAKGGEVILARVETKKFLLLLTQQAPQLEKDLRRYSRESVKWRIETTGSVAAVMSAYESFPPDLVVLDPALLEGSVESLLEHAKRNWPRTFFLLLSDRPEADFQAVFERFGSLPIIAPESALSVSKAIEKEMVGLVNGTLRGLMLSSFLQMMEWEAKSVSIHVSAAEKWGRIHLYKGKFVSAYVHRQELSNKQAAIEIMMWDNISIAVERSYHNHNNQPTLPLSSLLMDAMVKKDEEAMAPAPPEQNNEPDAEATSNLDIFSEDAFDDPPEFEFDDAIAVSEEIDEDEMGLYIIQTSVPSSISVPSKEIEKKLLGKPNSRDILVGDILSIDGAVAAALVDYSSGMALDMVGSGIDLELAGAGTTEVVRAQKRSMELLGIEGQIEDMMVTLEQQYHLLYILPGTTLFLYVVLRKEQANLAMARYKLKAAAAQLQL